jgi:hypothetical protein
LPPLSHGACAAADAFGQAAPKKEAIRLWKAGGNADLPDRNAPGDGQDASRQGFEDIWNVPLKLACRPLVVRYFGSIAHPEAGMAELADAADSKSAGPCGHGGSTPPPGTNKINTLRKYRHLRMPFSMPKL